MIPTKILAIPPLGCVGIHASLLPKYRGGAPLVWAMIHGERETGVTMFFFEKGMDSGDVIAQNRFRIEQEDTISDVLRKSKLASLSILTEFLPQIASGTAPRIPQDESQATYFPQRSPEDGRIDWSWSSEQIRNFIRAQTKPYPGAYTIVNDKKLIIWSADVVETNHREKPSDTPYDSIEAIDRPDLLEF